MSQHEPEVQKNLIYIPGVYVCRKCKFELYSRVMYVQSGNIGPNSKRDDCPNDGAVLEPKTWRELAEQSEASSEQAFKNGYERGRTEEAELGRSATEELKRQRDEAMRLLDWYKESYIGNLDMQRVYEALKKSVGE